MSFFRSIGLVLIGFAALALLAWGWVVWLPLVNTVSADHGPTWGYAALGAALAGTSVVAWGLWKLQDLLTLREGGGGGRTPVQLYCQRCGHPAAQRDTFCNNCGDRRFGTRRPATSAAGDSR
ncbi:MAG TPA: zinc ribbon domain-containing protein [Chloroflexota bacterium]|nr:zinc ribbon domain-containing protein [Chloroflexota bacterium]